MGRPLSTLRTQRAQVTLSLTPLIDVVFILLVFFMLVSQFADWRQIDLLPQASMGSGTSDIRPLVVGLHPDHSIHIGNQSTHEMAEAISMVKAKAASDGAVIIQAKPGVAIQPVIDLVEALAAAEINNVRVDAESAK